MYAVFQEGGSIIAIGHTEAEALESAGLTSAITSYHGVQGTVYVLPCTDALAAAVTARGGAIWYEVEGRGERALVTL